MKATERHRTPKLSTIRAGWVQGHPFPLTTDPDERYAEFDRAMAAHDAEIRADAWDEGALWAAVETGAIRGESDPFLVPDDNPYRTPRPPAPELFPGVQERLDALSIRKATP